MREISDDMVESRGGEESKKTKIISNPTTKVRGFNRDLYEIL